MHPVIQSALAVEHVKDMLDHATENNRARDARRSRPARRWGRHARPAAASRAARHNPAPTQ